MRILLFALVLVVAGAYATAPASDVLVADSPNQQTPRAIVDDLIRHIIQLISDGIKKAGLDPIEIKEAQLIFPREPFAVRVKALLENFKYDGASNIKINSLDYTVNPNKLSFNISLPQLSLNIGDSGIEIDVFNYKVDGQLKGSLITESIGLSGEATVSVGSISHIDLLSISLNFGVGNIKSELSVWALGNDVSKFVNNFFNEIIPNALKKYGHVINAFLEKIVKGVFFLINILFHFFY